MRRGDVYYADLDPTRGSEQSGRRPVLVIQRTALSAAVPTVVIIPFTTTLRRRGEPSSAFVPAGEGGLRQDSVALCNQIRVLDKSRLLQRWGSLPSTRLSRIEDALRFTVDL